MLRPALLRKSAAQGLQKAVTRSLPAPVGGWNARDPLAAMPEKDAIVLENWFPKAADVAVRPGAIAHKTGFGSTVRTLMAWNGYANQKLFAATDTGIFDATVSGAVGASVSALTNGALQYVNFSTVAGMFLVAVNGDDKLKLYDGVAWADVDGLSPIAITGLATTSLVSVAVIKKRLWFVERNSMSVWYLPVAQVGGALTEFPLGQLFSRGGHVVAAGTWTIDGGAGSDDYAVFITSEGEVAVYKGTDPGAAATWAHVGTYYIGEPVGRNCFCKFGGDLLILCQNGLYPLSRAVQSSLVDRSAALTSKIDTAFTEAVTLYGHNIGWQAISYPQGSFVLVNVPVTASYVQQYVMNSITGAWCRFSGWNASAWEVFGENLYFAGTDKVARAWVGNSDFGAAIFAKAQQAYSYFGNRAQQKHFKLVRPVVALGGKVTLQLGMDADYTIGKFASFTATGPVENYVWDSSEWNAATWAANSETRRDWATIFAKECYAGAFRLQCAVTSATLRWSATDFVYERGGVL